MGIQITRTGDILGMSEPIFFPELIFLNCYFQILWIMDKKNEAAKRTGNKCLETEYRNRYVNHTT